MPAEKIARPVNRKHRAFCRAVATGMSQSQAYQRYVSRKSERPWVVASHLATRFRPHINSLRDQFGRVSDRLGILGKSELAQYLSRAVVTPIGEIDENSDLCQEKTTTTSEYGTTVKLKSVNKLDAASQLSKLVGYNEAERVEITHRVETPLLQFINSTNGNARVIGNGYMPICAYDPLPNGEFSPVVREAQDAELVPIAHQDLPADGLGIGRKVVFKSQE
jgi:hypothetical protein